MRHRHNTIFSVSDCPGCRTCDINPCVHGGQCNRLIGKAVCTCPPCYTGQHCEHGEAVQEQFNVNGALGVHAVAVCTSCDLKHPTLVENACLSPCNLYIHIVHHTQEPSAHLLVRQWCINEMCMHTGHYACFYACAGPIFVHLVSCLPFTLTGQ